MPPVAPTPTWLVPAAVVGAYLLGSLSPGWWLVRKQVGIDLRRAGSGATGASNAGRLLGTSGYAAVLFLDTVKGALAVCAARWSAPDHPWALLAAPAVVAGHIWPVWLRFKGGRGAGPVMGAFLALQIWIVPVSWLVGLAAWTITRKGLAARIAAFLTSLPAGLYFIRDLPGRACLAAAWALVLLAHRGYFLKQGSR